MLPFFNTSGPCIPGEHYMLPPERRLHDVLALIEGRRFLTLHAGRQTGKTTSLMWLEAHLNGTGQWTAVWVDLETARETPDVSEAMTAILKVLDRRLEVWYPQLPRPTASERDMMLATPNTALVEYLGWLASHAPHPLVLLLDEVDGLVGEAMVSFLTQLRHGYIERSQTPFPASVVLVGQRQVGCETAGFDFNITAEAMTLRSFTEAEVGELLAQHTAVTGQRFSPEAVARIWGLGRGYPWLAT